jgi:hypothetical protein
VIPAQIGCHDVAPGRGKRGQLVAPRPPKFRKAMQQEHERSPASTRAHDVQGKLTHVDELVLERFRGERGRHAERP